MSLCVRESDLDGRSLVADFVVEALFVPATVPNSVIPSDLSEGADF